MSIPLSREVHAPALEEGETYDAKIIKVEQKDGVETSFGEKNQIWITFLVRGNSKTEVEITRRYTNSLFPKSNLAKLITALDGENFDGSTYDAELLETLPCRVLIKHTKNDETGDTWDNIDTVLKPKFSQNKQPTSLNELAELQD